MPIDYPGILDDVPEYELRLRAHDALQLIVRFGGIDGDHHKAWVLDQVVRALAGQRYADLVRDACAGADGPNTYTWEEGIPPCGGDTSTRPVIQGRGELALLGPAVVLQHLREGAVQPARRRPGAPVQVLLHRVPAGDGVDHHLVHAQPALQPAAGAGKVKILARGFERHTGLVAAAQCLGPCAGRGGPEAGTFSYCISPTGRIDWERDSVHWRGRVLRGRYAHWCPDWDELPIDESCGEWPCGCASRLVGHDVEEPAT